MLKNALLALSLLANGAVGLCLFFPATANGPRMSCDEARSDADNKRATETFARANGASLAKTHDFLRNSGYDLRNVDGQGGAVTFVYVATRYSTTCGIHLPGGDGGIVRLGTDAKSEPLITRVF